MFAVQHSVDPAYVYTLVYPHALLFQPTSPEAVSPRVWVYALLLVEAASPGVVLGTVARLAAHRPKASQATPRKRIPTAGLVILGALLAALGVVVVLRLQQGFLTADSALAAIRFLLRFAVLPIVLYLAFTRLTRRQALSG